MNVTNIVSHTKITILKSDVQNTLHIVYVTKIAVVKISTNWR